MSFGSTAAFNLYSDITQDKRPFLLEEELPALPEQSTMEKLVSVLQKNVV